MYEERSALYTDQITHMDDASVDTARKHLELAKEIAIEREKEKQRIAEIHEEQNCPKDLNSIDYWGFLKNGEQEEDMRLIFPNYKQFSVCFPYGISVEEENKTGKSYRLRVKKFKEI